MKCCKLIFLLVFLIFPFGILIAQQRPNILWITIEDTSPQFIGCYGNEDARTPVIDQFAKNGIRFTNAFSTGTVCSPSRSTIITGVPTYKMGTGHHRSNYPIPEFIKGFPSYLKNKGYYTTNNVKTDYNIANEQDFIKEAWHESSKTASWEGRTENQPFFSVFNFAESHQSRTMSMSYDWYLKNVWNHLPESDRIADKAFSMPPFYKDTPAMRKQFARVYNSIKLTDNRIGELLKKLEDDNLRDDTIIFFFADHGEGIPRGKTNGINLGYRVPLIIWFPEKYTHLSPWGKAGSVSDQLINFEDLAPTVLQLAGITKIPEYFKGQSLIGKNRSKEKAYLLLSTDRADNGTDLVRTITDGKFIYSRNFMPFMPEMRYIRYLEIADITQQIRSDYKNGLLNTLQKSLFKQRPSEVLYDIKNDLWETTNLIDNPKYKSVVTQMRNQLNKSLVNARDVHFLPEYEIGLLSTNETAYEYRLNDAKFNFKEIYAAATLSGIRTKETTKKQIKLLNDPDKIVRYWSAIGLLSQKGEDLKRYKKQLTKALKDTYPPVAIASAAILYQHFKTKNSRALLTKYIQSGNNDLALMSINHVLYFDYKTPFISTIQKVYKMPKRSYNVKAACMDFLGILNLVENSSATEN